MIKILFVCLGNICRSPLAEAIFNKKVNSAGLSNKIISDSAGTGNYHVGKNPDPRSIDVARKHKIPIHHKGRQITINDASAFDYLIAMDESNKRNIIHLMGQNPEGLLLMRDFDEVEKGGDVPDPYYGGQDGFENVYQILDHSLDNLLKFLIDKYKL
jgi:protein-tyrosine phosphatase